MQVNQNDARLSVSRSCYKTEQRNETLTFNSFFDVLSTHKARSHVCNSEVKSWIPTVLTKLELNSEKERAA
jgi:hypothetical protein